MESILDLVQLVEHLKAQKSRRRVVVVCAGDSHTEEAVSRALKEGIAEFLLIGGAGIRQCALLRQYPRYVRSLVIEDPDEAAREAVRVVRAGDADILMKGLVNTDNLLHAVLDKENGLLLPGRTLTHIAMAEIPAYPKLLLFSDAAVIPRPTLQQRKEIIGYAVGICRRFGIARPRIALIHCTEKVSGKFPHSLDYARLVELAANGEFGDVIVDGPLDVYTACEQSSGGIKGIASPIGGQADVLMFPNIESGNVFYKSISLFARAEMAGILQGTVCPVVVSSRSDPGRFKYNSLVMACLQVEGWH